MSAPILVTGGTGTLGGHLVPRLRAAGLELRILSRKPHESGDGVEYVIGDLLTGEGISSALEGIHTVVHLAGRPKGDEVSTATLTRAAVKAGVRHLVCISVIATDRIPVGYYRSKLGAEQAVTASGVPWTTLRAAQFHDLLLTVAQKTTAVLPVLPVPATVRLQPVDARDVADRLVELTLSEPAGRVRDLAGPEVLLLPDLIRGYLRASGKHRMLVPVPMPAAIGRLYREGKNLNLEDADLGTRTWQEFLAGRIGPR